jgi:hypothetical protein
LTPHKSGQFCKKIRGKIHYFGKIDDPDAALRRYYEHANGLHAGTISQVDRTGEVTVAELANQFLAAKDRKRANGDIEAATFVEYHRDCELMVQHFGRDREVSSITRRDLAEFRDFLGKGVNATTLNNRIGSARRCDSARSSSVQRNGCCGEPKPKRVERIFMQTRFVA